MSINRQAHFPSFGTGFGRIKASKEIAGSYSIKLSYNLYPLQKVLQQLLVFGFFPELFCQVRRY